MTAPKVGRGERLKADKQNRLIDQANKTAEPVGDGRVRVSHGAGGVAFTVPPGTRLCLFELTEAVTWPDPDVATDDPTPRADNCRRVWWYYDSPTDLEKYGETDQSPDESVWFPTCFRNTAGVGIGNEAVGDGDRVYAVWSQQSGRWEAVTPPLGIWRFELNETLVTGSNATAHLIRINPAGSVTEEASITFEVYDPFTIFSGVAGDRGYAAYFGDSTHLEILQMVC
jgi:hypothetical protein